MFKPVRVAKEVYGGGENLLVCGNAARPPKEIRDLYGTAQCVYIDPPFMTGGSFERTRPVGTAGWRKGRPVIRIPGYDDSSANEASYVRMLKSMVRSAWRLLGPTGVFYLHLDWRMSARGRIICDEVFGKGNFLNEIIWGYESGGRSKKFFPRKHDTIIMYARTKKYRFDITAVPLPRIREGKPRNHMSRAMDENGRMYSYIVSAGKEYRYYDDEPVYPGDVWTDIGHLQQLDPERTGYPTQKPLKLMERLLLPVAAEGDLVVDLCCGSGSFIEQAQRMGCRFAGMDMNPDAVSVTMARLKPDNLTVVCPTSTDGVKLAAVDDRENGRFTIGGLEAGEGDDIFPRGCGAMDRLESWETGEIRDGVFYSGDVYRRSFRYPDIADSLRIDPESVSAVMTTDAAGVRRAFSREK